MKSVSVDGGNHAPCDSPSREQVQSLEGELALTHLTEAGHRQQAAEASARSLRCREELVKYVEEVHRLLGDNAAVQRERSEAAGQVSAAEEAIKVGRVGSECEHGYGGFTTSCEINAW